MNTISLKTVYVMFGVICIYWLLPVPTVFCREIWKPETLTVLIQEGLKNNLDIQSQKKLVESLQYDSKAAGALDDPMIGFGLANLPTDTFRFDQEPMTQKQFFVSQKIPWPGKRNLDAQLISLKAQKAELMLQQKQLVLARQIAVLYFDLGLLDQRITLNSRLKSLIEPIIDNSRTRYAVGKGLQMDVLQGQLELSRIADEEITLIKQRRAVQDDINRLLSRSEFQTIDVVSEPDIPDLILDKNFLIEQALKHNSQLNQLRADIQTADVQVLLAQKTYYPNFDLKLSYGQRDEDRTGRDLADFVSATVGLNLPLWKNKKQDNMLAAAQNRTHAARLSVDAFIAALPFQIDNLINEIESAKINYAIYKNEVLVQARQWVDSAVSAYEVDKLPFDTMINAHIRLLQLHLKQEEHLFRILKKYAELEDLIGSSLLTADDADNQHRTGDQP